MAVEAGAGEAAAGGSAVAGARGATAGRPAYRGRHAGRSSDYKGRHAGAQRPAPGRRSSGRTLQPQVAGRKTAGQPGLQPQVAGKNADGAGRGSGQGQQQDQAQSRFQQQAAKRGKQLGAHLSAGTYHRVVIAEFLATVLIIAAAPFLVPRDAGSGTPAEEADAAVKSLALSRPLTRLTAVCVLFFILALSANGERTGRVAAAFGGLVMLGALLNATDTWAALGQVFAGAARPAKDAGPLDAAGIADTAKNAVG